MNKNVYISYDAIWHTLVEYADWDPEPKSVMRALREIDRMPDGDKLQIVTCEHCDHSWMSGGGLRFCDKFRDNDHNFMVDDNDFCAWGRQKEGNQ